MSMPGTSLLESSCLFLLKAAIDLIFRYDIASHSGLFLLRQEAVTINYCGECATKRVVKCFDCGLFQVVLFISLEHIPLCYMYCIFCMHMNPRRTEHTVGFFFFWLGSFPPVVYFLCARCWLT